MTKCMLIEKATLDSRSQRNTLKLLEIKISGLALHLVAGSAGILVTSRWYPPWSTAAPHFRIDGCLVERLAVGRGGCGMVVVKVMSKGRRRRLIVNPRSGQFHN